MLPVAEFIFWVLMRMTDNHRVLLNGYPVVDWDMTVVKRGDVLVLDEVEYRIP